MAAVAVEAAPASKFAAARRLGGMKRVSARDSVYSSAEGEAQETASRNTLDDFDRRLKEQQSQSDQ